MAITRPQTQVQWGAVDFIDIGAGAIEISDEIIFAVDMYAWSLSIYLDHQGTPASGDAVDFYLSWTNGETDGTVGNDYDTPEMRDLYQLRQLDTFENALDGVAPDNGIVQKTWPELPIGAAGFKIVADSQAAATIRARARITQVLSGG